MKPGRASLILWGLAYLLCATGIVVATWRGRASAVATYDSASGQAGWQEWKDAARKMSDEARKISDEGATMGRRVPKSDEPPALILLRDHFGTSLAGMLLAFTAIFAVFMVLVRGAASTSSIAPPLSEAEERRQRGL